MQNGDLARFFYLTLTRMIDSDTLGTQERVRYTVQPVLSGHSKRAAKLVFNTNYRLMQVKSIAECSNELPFDIKIFVLSIFEWPLKTGFTVTMMINKPSLFQLLYTYSILFLL